PGELLHGLAHCIFQAGPVAVAFVKEILLDQMSDDLSIGLSGELVPFFNQLLFEREIVFDNPVLHNDDFAGSVAMRMSVFFRGTAMRRPARVADSVHALKRFEPDSLFQVAQLAFSAPHLEFARVTVAGHGDPGRVVSAILQLLEPVDDDGHHALFTYVTYDS